MAHSWGVLHLPRLCRRMLSDSGEILGLRPPSATTHVVTQPAQVAAALLGVEWPTPRWPLYVFLAGAMACLLTSATCHLLAACSSEVHAQSAMAMSPDSQDGGTSIVTVHAGWVVSEVQLTQFMSCGLRRSTGLCGGWTTPVCHLTPSPCPVIIR